MRRWFGVALTIFFTLSAGRAFSVSLEGFNSLNDIKAFSSENNVRLSIDFKKPLKDYKGPIFYEKSIQIDFPDSYISPAKRKFQVGDDLIQEITAYQYNKDVVRVRFVLARSQYDLDKNFTLETRDGNMIFSIRKLPSDPLARLLEKSTSETKEAAQAPAPAEPREVQVQTVQKKTEPEAAPPDEAKVKKEPTQGSGSLPDSLFASLEPAKGAAGQGKLNQEPAVLALHTGENAPDLFSASVKIYGALFAILAVFLVIFYFAKNHFFNGILALNKDKLIDVIATNHIGARKFISLVEVAGEVLVLGVSNNHISMLTRIEDMSMVEKLKQHKARFPKSNPLGGFKFPFPFPKKDKTAAPDLDFSSHLKSFSPDSPPEPEFTKPNNTAADVARLIQDRLGRARKSEKMDFSIESVV
ncbi:MAG: flagellar biosynthetic protein FliO [Nitrospinae bacterium]|nr:flagellar biosynthetic protein FliO [Nitrospinota bacterium]